jgi:hypothetical protein
MYIALAVLMILHGMAHMVGFAAPFGYLKDPPPVNATLLSTIGPGGMKALGILWFANAIIFVVAGIGLLRHSQWWTTATIAACVLSLVLTATFLPYAKIGLAVDVVLVTFLYLNRNAGWIASTV